jgi:hypothetical protein
MTRRVPAVTVVRAKFSKNCAIGRWGMSGRTGTLSEPYWPGYLAPGPNLVASSDHSP